MLGRGRKLRLDTERMILRAPVHGDYRAWAALREESREFLVPWEPTWAPDHLTRKSFTNRVYWAQRSIANGTAVPLFLIRREDEALMGAITLDNIRRGPAQAGTTGYWIGASFARQGYMREALLALVHHAFSGMDLSRIEAGCLPENTPSRRLLEACGFKYEGVAQSYLQISGRWRNHVLYANLRHDRRGRSDAG
jgi:ribosomal-protein-alanine N-acetyltransferase